MAGSVRRLPAEDFELKEIELHGHPVAYRCAGRGPAICSSTGSPHELVPTSRLELFEGAGHFPHLDEPQRFLDVLLDFIESTDPADVDPEQWREMLMIGRRA